MRRSVFGKVSAAVLAFSMIFGGVSASAMAQSDGSPAPQFIDMEGIELIGSARGASVVKIKGKKSATFSKLGRIEKRSLLPSLQETSEERALSGAD